MSVTIFVETPRLILRELLPLDVDGMFDLDADPEVHRYLGNQPLQEKHQAEKVIEFVRRQYVDNGIGRWAMVDKASGDFVGWTGLKLVKDTINGRSNIHDLGYRIRRKYWGKGLATESAIAALTYGFEVLRLQMIYAAAHVDNGASNKILQKMGMEFVNSFEHDGEPHHWYQLAAHSWKNGRPQIQS